jgi:hypothetical protein
MNIYIVWKKICDNEVKSHILGIYKDRNSALKKCDEFNKNIIEDEDTDITVSEGELHNESEETDTNEDEETNIIVSNDGLLGKYSLIGNWDNLCYCTQLEVDDEASEVYLIKITEDGGGGSWHRDYLIYASTDEDDLINIAENYFSTEHNLKNDCRYCINNQCKGKFIRDLKEQKRTGIDDCGSYSYHVALFAIWSVKIQL